jgi:hypothetical protein
MFRATLVFALVAALVSPAVAGVDYFHAVDDPRVVTVTARPPRPLRDKLVIGGLAVGAAAAVGVGIMFNLDSRRDARAVSADHFTGQPWTADDQRTFDKAHKDGVKAGVFYGVGALFVVGSLVALWMTEQPEHEVRIGPDGARLSTPTPTLAPTHGGAVLGATWTF